MFYLAHGLSERSKRIGEKIGKERSLPTHTRGVDIFHFIYNRVRNSESEHRLRVPLKYTLHIEACYTSCQNVPTNKAISNEILSGRQLPIPGTGHWKQTKVYIQFHVLIDDKEDASLHE